MRASDVYRSLRSSWSDALKADGLTRVPRRPCTWWLARSNYNLMLTAYVDPRGWDRYAGSSFVVEFEATDRRDFGWQPQHRARLGHSLDAAALEAVLRQQNLVISRLRRPSKAELGFPDADWDGDLYLAETFDPVTGLPPSDLHFRYFEEKDVREWAGLLRAWLGPDLLAFEERWLDSAGPAALRRSGYTPTPS